MIPGTMTTHVNSCTRTCPTTASCSNESSANDLAILARLGGDFRKVAELIGVENALKISAEFGGLWISVPKLDGLKRDVRDRAIRKAYDESKDKTALVRRLARENDLTTRQIYNILGVQPEGTEFVLPLFSEATPVK